MANLLHQHPDGGWVNDGNWWHDENVYLNSQNTGANTSNITIETVVYSISSGNTQSGTWVNQMWVAGALWVNSSSSRSVNNGAQQIGVASGDVGHDTNGNCTVYIEYYVNEPATSMSRRGANYSLPRIALAPSFLAITADTITPTSVRLGAELSSYGHGTSATLEMFYRLQGSSTWISLGQQGDVGGYNYWTATGLTPGRTYEYYNNVFNNNGDATASGTQTVKTKSIAGMIPLLMALTQ